MDEGHEVAFATAGSFADQVEAAGFPILPAGIGQDELETRFAPYRERVRAMPIEERRPFGFTWRFALLDSPAKLPELRRAAEAWGPDLVVHESSDVAAPIVAAALGIRSVHQSFGRIIPLACLEQAAVEIEPLWRDAGLEPEPLCGAFRGVYVDICPPSFQTLAPPAGTHVEPMRPLFPPSPREREPAWLAKLPDRATVYVTLGTVHNDLALFRLLLDALAGLNCNVVATIGRDNDPGALEPTPSNAIVERYVPQSFLLQHCAAVVAHGGSGSILAALAEGLPALLVPQGADQFDNAAQCAALGAGLTLLPEEITPEAVRTAVATLLDEPSYRENAGRLAAEIAAMPHPDDVVPSLVGDSPPGHR